MSNHKFGVAALIVNGDKILLGQKIDPGSLLHGQWVLPGGKLENDESIEEGTRREIYEETNLSLDHLSHPQLRELKFADGKRYIMFYLSGTAFNVHDLQLKEPDKCQRWQWFRMSALPKNCWDLESIKLFYPNAAMIRGTDGQES